MFVWASECVPPLMRKVAPLSSKVPEPFTAPPDHVPAETTLSVPPAPGENVPLPSVKPVIVIGTNKNALPAGSLRFASKSFPPPLFGKVGVLFQLPVTSQLPVVFGFQVA